MLNKTLLLIGLGIAVVSSHAQAQAHAVRERLAGYECMMLNITEQQAMDPNFHVGVKAQPSPTSATVGWQPGIVIVKEPAVPRNGYLQILRANGQEAWIEANIVKAYHPLSDPNAKCAPELLPNGLIGSGPG